MMHHSPRFRALITFSAALILAAVACNTPAGTPPTATAPIVMDAVPAPTTQAVSPTTPSETVVLPPTPTVPATVDAGTSVTPTNAPPDAPPANADYNGISFFYNNDVSSGWEVEVVPAQDGSDGTPPEWLAPSHYRFVLTGYAPADTLQQPVILVFPIENFVEDTAGMSFVEITRGLIETPPPDVALLEGTGSVGGQELPAMPIFGVPQMFRARAEYIAFQNGRGLRYITQFSHQAAPVNNRELLYVFQGITYDNQYFVSVIMPISHPSLPTEYTQADYDAAAADFEGYLNGVIDTLDGDDPASFTPDLSLLDQMVNSLTVAIAP